MKFPYGISNFEKLRSEGYFYVDKTHYFIELKYVKARASKSTLANKDREGIAEMKKYLQSETARAIKHLQAYVLVFRKDKCMRKIPC